MTILKGRKAQGTAGSIVRYGNKGRGQRVRSSGWQWSEEAEAIFFEVLAASCNVTLAADEAGYSTPTVYRQRQMRPEFAARWDEALRQGYARIEMAMVQAAADSMDGTPFEGDRPIPRMTVEQAMNLLKLHYAQVTGQGGRAGRAARIKSFDEVKGGLLRKIEVMVAARKVAAD